MCEVLIYGATGYTGRLIVARAVARGLRPVLAGRSGAALAVLAGELGLAHEVVAVDDDERLRQAVGRVAVVLNAAGPFSETACPLIDACLTAHTHYTDVTGEVLVIEAAAGRNADAQRSGVMVMPAVGFDVVPSDGLAAHVARRLPGARTLRLGIHGLSAVSPGSARTIVGQMGLGVWVRRAGHLTAVTPGSLRRDFDYGDGPRESLAVSWGDVSSAFFSTGIPNIEVYFASTPALRTALAANRAWGWLLARPAFRSAPIRSAIERRAAGWMVRAPSATEQVGTPITLVAEAEDASGRRWVRARLRTPEVYGFTAITAVAIVERILAGDLEAGFQTPARVYGEDFVLSLGPNVTREELTDEAS